MAAYVRKCFSCIALFVALFLVRGLALAQGPGSDRPTVWHCWYNDNGSFTVACEYRGPEEPSEIALPEVDDAEFVAVSYPGRGANLPKIVRTILESPASLQGQQILIPLYTYPYDMDFVRQLAEAVMCGTGKNCAVVFGQEHTVSASLPAAY